MHDDLYKENRNAIIKDHTKFFEIIKYGPHFYCCCCTRGFYKNQVVKASNELLKKKILFNGKEIAWFRAVKSLDNLIHLCKCCLENVKKGSLPKLAVANGNDFPDIPNSIANKND